MRHDPCPRTPKWDRSLSGHNQPHRRWSHRLRKAPADQRGPRSAVAELRLLRGAHRRQARRPQHGPRCGLDHLPPRPPERQIKSLRPYGKENYVIASPYPGQDAPVIATSWRVHLELDGADDPRLRRFVNQFRISELAPLSGNRCTLGVGNPRGMGG